MSSERRVPPSYWPSSRFKRFDVLGLLLVLTLLPMINLILAYSREIPHTSVAEAPISAAFAAPVGQKKQVQFVFPVSMTFV